MPASRWTKKAALIMNAQRSVEHPSSAIISAAFSVQREPEPAYNLHLRTLRINLGGATTVGTPTTPSRLLPASTQELKCFRSTTQIPNLPPHPQSCCTYNYYHHHHHHHQHRREARTPSSPSSPSSNTKPTRPTGQRRLSYSWPRLSLPPSAHCAA
jgi:hypothetical protein